MARPLILDAAALFDRLQAEGFDLQADGDRLRVRPADRVTPELRDALARAKPALLDRLRPVPAFVTLRNGPTLPAPAWRLALDLEARGFRHTVDPAGHVLIEPASDLTDADRAGIARWRSHLAAILAYQAPVLA